MRRKNSRFWKCVDRSEWGYSSGRYVVRQLSHNVYSSHRSLVEAVLCFCRVGSFEKFQGNNFGIKEKSTSRHRAATEPENMVAVRDWIEIGVLHENTWFPYD